MDKVTDGLKHDGSKPRLALVPPEAVEAIGKVMTKALEKYDENSWRKVSPSRYRDALMRHWCEYIKDPQKCDTDSGYPHIWHVLTNAAFLVALEMEEKTNEL